MNIQSMLQALFEAGLSEGAIAEAVATTQPTIHRLRTGKISDARYTLGKDIEALYRKQCAEKQSATAA